MDIETVQIMLTKAAIFVPITTGLVQAIKMTEYIPLRFLPIMSLVIGCVIGWFFVAAGSLGILAGLAIGLAAVGLFEFGKTTLVGNVGSGK